MNIGTFFERMAVAIEAMPGMAKADASTNGYLSKEDYAIFLAKQAALADGVPFKKVVTLTSALATTAVHILTAAEVGAGKKVYITNFLLDVNGAVAWAGTGTVVKIQDTNGTPVVAVSVAKAQLTNAALLGPLSTGVTLGAAVKTGVGLTAAKGLDIVADGTFETGGSDIVLTITGFIGA